MLRAQQQEESSWDYLGHNADTHKMPWIVPGDFNIVDPTEQMGGRPHRMTIRMDSL